MCSYTEPIHIIVKPNIIDVMTETTVTFNCKESTGSFLHHIEWLFNNKLIDFGNEPRIIKTNNNLTITNTTEIDSGNYTCVTQTKFNNATASGMLIVQV